jgi:hypothetical protein
MVNDLMTNVLTIGIDTLKIKDLLGEPWNKYGKSRWNYKLGVYREMESSYLVVELDETGKLKSTSIIDR